MRRSCGLLTGTVWGDGLPSALIHPDFVLANVIASPGRGMVFVAWTGAGQGPRAWSLAFLLCAEATKNPGRCQTDRVWLPAARTAGAGRDRAPPGPDAGAAAVLAAWSLCLGRWSAGQATRAVLDARMAETVGPRIVAALRARPS
jgi:hypothetical protein